MNDKTSTKNFNLRTLHPEIDDLKNYLTWLRDINSNQYIESSDENYTLEKLIMYIKDKNNSPAALLLGIFEKSSNIHIGNIKIEPINFSKEAWLGIMIGEQDYRNKGYGTEILKHGLEFSKKKYNLKKMCLGVNINNEPAMRTYKKIGFKEVGKINQDNIKMEYFYS
jgi:ribosomal-protein-alanine N-acetyltransferase